MIHVKMIIPVWNHYAQFVRILAGILGVICICLIALQGFSLTGRKIAFTAEAISSKYQMLALYFGLMEGY